jgi:hypothetical protein
MAPQADQVALVATHNFPATDMVQHFDFTLKTGSAFWVYTPVVGLVEGEDGSLWNVSMWLTEWVDYQVPPGTEREQDAARLEAFHADLRRQM